MDEFCFKSSNDLWIQADEDYIPWTIENPHLDPWCLLDEATVFMEDCFTLDDLELPF